jgi:predicted PurR-regulated permease PerM
VLAAFTLVAVTMDNLLRPLLIKKGVDLPLLLILGGVIGGLLAFGIIGLFIGPVVLAVTYTLIGSWVRDDPDGCLGAGAGDETERLPPAGKTGGDPAHATERPAGQGEL